MGRTASRRQFSILGCLAIVLLGLASTSVALREFSGPKPGAATQSSIPDPATPHVVQDATTAIPPTMGWNSWNHFACGIDETLIRETADAIVNSGLQAAGYDVVALDACWSARNRDGAGNLTNDPQTFPSGMKALGDYIHARGLRYGIYASIGTLMCGAVGPGSLDHEFQDVATFASWGVDYIKADRCSADGQVIKDLYARWRDAIVASGRPIVLSASDNIAVQEPWAWGPVTAHQWRMSDDIKDNWATMMGIFDLNMLHAAATAPGRYNDPDMLEVGNGGMSDTEYRTHLGLWALMSAPLIAGNDVRTMSTSILGILTNPEVIAVDQDSFAFQATKAADNGGGQQVWYKPISTMGGRAVGLLNRGSAAATMTVDWDTIGLASGNATVRDLWARVDRGTFANRYSVSVPSHGLALLQIIGADKIVTDGFLGDQPWTYMANEVGPVERNRSNGGVSSSDGQTLRLDGVSYAKGLGGHAPSALEFRLSPGCSNFSAHIGVDDEAGNRGSVVFQVWGDGRRLYESGVMTGTTTTSNVGVDISGVSSLRLTVVAVDDTNYDSADWADARVTCSSQANAPPQARFQVSASPVRPGDTVTFDGRASTDPDGTIRSYAWDFGDGSADGGAVVSHAYTQSGRFQVILTVVDDKGAANSATAILVVNRPPKAAFSVSPSAALPGDSLRFDASNSTDLDGRISSYAWNFGDGTTSEGVVVTHVYVARGGFPVRLLVTDDLGATNETNDRIEIANRSPGILSATPASSVVLGVTESKSFVVVASDSDGDPLTFSWFVDGFRASPTSSSFSFVSMRAGTFVLRVSVSDGWDSATYEWHIEVRDWTVPTAPTPPPAEFPAAIASIGMVTITVLASVLIHALRSRKRGL